MEINITWTITAIIAVSSFLSPIVVAMINNRHHARLRKMELEHDEYIRWLDLQQTTAVKQFDIYYADKKKSFADFANAAGQFSFSKQTAQAYQELQSTTHIAMLYCNKSNYDLLSGFLEYADSIFGNGYTRNERDEYTKTLTSITTSLNEELASTKPVIQREPGKS